MVTTGRRLAEKGQRTTRSTDAYGLQSAPGAAAVCRGCGAIYRNKRWYGAEGAGVRPADAKEVLCKACQRTADANPAGIVLLQGSYLKDHEEVILNQVRQSEARARQKNPLGRIMGITREGEGLAIATTEDKLAQRLGRDIFKAHGGELLYRWSHEQHFVRVNWRR